MDLSVLENLEAVFDTPEEEVVFLERQSHSLRDRILLAEKFQSVERVPFKERRDPCSVNQLQSLHKKLHIAESADPALHIRRCAGIGFGSHGPHSFNGLGNVLPFPILQE